MAFPTMALIRGSDLLQGTPSLEELKLTYYRLYIQYYQQEYNYLEVRHNSNW